jgi:uncharacterized protein
VPASLPESIQTPLARETAPISGRERLTSLDFTRGIAVMGILFANIIGMGQPYSAYTWPGGFFSSHDQLADWLWVVQFVVIDGKMRGLFTLLFGAGLVLFAERAVARGGGRWLAPVRLFWLFLFGLAHFYLLWRGDILTLYAMGGAIALVAVNWTPVQQFAVGLTAYVFGVIYNTVSLVPVWIANDTNRATLPEYSGIAKATDEIIASDRADALREASISADGTWLDYVAHTATVHRWEWLDVFIYSSTEVIPLMLIGMALFRIGLFDGRLNRRSQAVWGWTGVIAGALLTMPLGLWVLSSDFSYATTIFAALGPQGLTRLPMVMGFAALLGLCTRADGWFSSRVVAAGRTAFSNYIGTSFVTLLVFQGWAIGLFGELSRESLYLVALAVCVVMLLWSKVWLARFRYGPLEWLWRCLTYRHIFRLTR